MYFGKKIRQLRREVIKETTEIVQDGGEGIYIGLPESFRISNVITLSYLKERLPQKVYGWQNKFLSPAGKEVLLKAVATAIPKFSMSCFLLPKTTCQQIEKILAVLFVEKLE